MIALEKLKKYTDKNRIFDFYKQKNTTKWKVATCVEVEKLICGRCTKHVKKLFEKVHDASTAVG